MCDKCDYKLYCSIKNFPKEICEEQEIWKRDEQEWREHQKNESTSELPYIISDGNIYEERDIP